MDVTERKKRFKNKRRCQWEARSGKRMRNVNKEGKGRRRGKMKGRRWEDRVDGQGRVEEGSFEERSQVWVRPSEGMKAEGAEKKSGDMPGFESWMWVSGREWGVGMTAALWWWASSLSLPPLSCSLPQVSVVLRLAVNHAASTLPLMRRTYFAHSPFFWSMLITEDTLSLYWLSGWLHFILIYSISALPFLSFFCPFFYSLCVFFMFCFLLHDQQWSAVSFPCST